MTEKNVFVLAKQAGMTITSTGVVCSTDQLLKFVRLLGKVIRQGVGK
jgi:hypothetical protein